MYKEITFMPTVSSVWVRLVSSSVAGLGLRWTRRPRRVTWWCQGKEGEQSHEAELGWSWV